MAIEHARAVNCPKCKAKLQSGAELYAHLIFCHEVGPVKAREQVDSILKTFITAGSGTP